MLAVSARAAEPAAPAGPAAKSYPLEAYAVIGSSFAQNRRLADLGWSDAQFEAFLDGVRAAFRGQPRPINDPARLLYEDIGRRLQQIEAEEARARQAFFADPGQLEAYMQEITKSFKLQRSDSGLAYGLLSESGFRPGPDDTVVVTYNAIAADAKTELPQLSAKQKRIKVADLLPGLAEGVQMMTAQASAMLVLPPDLSYGNGNWPPDVIRGSPLIFTLTLHEIITAP